MFSKRIEVGVSIFKVGGELRTEGESSGRRGVLENFEILDCRRCISEHILPLDSPKNFGTLKGIFLVKYPTMLYQWQLVKNKVIQSKFPGNFHDKINFRITLLQEELKNVVIYNYK